jgi:ankyrin repeat protein
MKVMNIAEAANDRDWYEVRRLVDRGEDLNALGGFLSGTGLHYAVKHGNKAICQLLLERGANGTAKDKQNEASPLHYASIEGSADLCELLVRYGADVTAVRDGGWTPLMLAVLFSRPASVCRPLISSASVNMTDLDGDQALHMASRKGLTETVQLLVECDADTSALNKRRQTPLHAAAGGDKDCPELCETLLQHGARTDAADKDGNQPLHLACKQGHSGIEKLLVDYGADVTATNLDGHTPVFLVTQQFSETEEDDTHPKVKLHVAAKTGNKQIILELIGSVVDVNTWNKQEGTLLHTAANGWLDCPQLCDILWKHSVKIDAVDQDGNQPLHLACRQSHTKIVKWLLQHDADINAMNKYKQSPLHMAAGSSKDSPELCKSLLTDGATLDAKDENADQPMHLACRQYRINTIRVLLSYGANFNSFNNKGKTPLHCLWTEHQSALKSMIDAGFDVNTADAGGNSCLHLVCEAGVTAIVQVLLCCSANVLSKNNDNETPLHKAASCLSDCPKVCLLLMRSGAEVNALDNNGDTPLHVALQHGNIDTARALMENGADCKIVNVHGETVLHSMVMGGVDSQDLFKDLTGHGASLHLADRKDNFPFHAALKNDCFKTFCILFEHWGGSTLDDLQKVNISDIDIGHLLCFAVHQCEYDICKKLLGYGADTNVVNKVELRVPFMGQYSSGKGFTPLHLSVARSDLNLCRLLLDHGASVNDKISLECLAQPLHIAVYLGNIDICHLLIERGASLNTRMKDRRSPLHLALVQNNEAIAHILLSHGATLDGVMTGDVSAIEKSTMEGIIASLLQLNESFPDEIVSQGEAAINIYRSSCGEGTVITVFLRVDVVGRDGAGKTSLTKSLTLQEFDANEPSTKGVVLDPRCQIIVREACDWTTRLTNEEYQEMYDKNITLIMAEKLDTPEVKGQYLTAKKEETELKEKQREQTDTNSRRASFTRKSYGIFSALDDYPRKSDKRPYNVPESNSSIMVVPDGSQCIVPELNSSIMGVPDGYPRESDRHQCNVPESNSSSMTPYAWSDHIPYGIPGHPIESQRQHLNAPRLHLSMMAPHPGVVGIPCYYGVPMCYPRELHRYYYNIPGSMMAPHQRVGSIPYSVPLGYPRVVPGSHLPMMAPHPEAVVIPYVIPMNYPVGLHFTSEAQAPMRTPIASASQYQPTDSWSSSGEVTQQMLIPGIENGFQHTDSPYGTSYDGATAHDPFADSMYSNKPEPDFLTPTTSIDCSIRCQQFEPTPSNVQSVNFHPQGSNALSQPEKAGTKQQSTNEVPSGLPQSKHMKKSGIKFLPKGFDTANQSEKANDKQQIGIANEAPATGPSNTIPEHIRKSVSDYLRNKKSRETAKNEIAVTVLDYAGQNVFYATHYLVLSKAGFYYVVFDASQPLKGKTPSIFRERNGKIVHIPYFDDETNFDRMEEWLSAIHIMEPEHEQNSKLFEELGILSPAIFLVGTHADEMRKQPGLQESQETYILSKLKNSELFGHIVKASKGRLCFYVDNTLTNPDSGTVDPQVHLLRKRTENVARKMAQRHRLPIKWMRFEQEVRDVKDKDKTKKTASVDELLELAMTTVGIKSREELEVLLH